MNTNETTPARYLDFNALNAEFAQLLSKHENDTEISNEEDRADHLATFSPAEWDEEEAAPVYNAFRDLCNLHPADNLNERTAWYFGLETSEYCKDYPHNDFDVYITDKDI